MRSILNHMASILADSNGKMTNKKWGEPIATADEKEQVAIILKGLKKKSSEYYSKASVDADHTIFIYEYVSDYFLCKGFSSRKAKYLSNKLSTIEFNSGKTKWPNEEEVKRELTEREFEVYKLFIKDYLSVVLEFTSTTDLILCLDNRFLFVEFKLLRPMGGKIRRLGDDFVKPLLFYDQAYPLSNNTGSIPTDYVRLKRITQDKFKTRNIEKYVVAIYYPFHNLCTDYRGLLRRAIKRYLKGNKFHTKHINDIINKLLSEEKFEKSKYEAIGLREDKIDILQRKIWPVVLEIRESKEDINKELKDNVSKLEVEEYFKLLQMVLKMFKIVSRRSKIKCFKSRKRNINWDNHFSINTPVGSKRKKNYSMLFHEKLILYAWQVD